MYHSMLGWTLQVNNSCKVSCFCFSNLNETLDWFIKIIQSQSLFDENFSLIQFIINEKFIVSFVLFIIQISLFLLYVCVELLAFHLWLFVCQYLFILSMCHSNCGSQMNYVSRRSLFLYHYPNVTPERESIPTEFVRFFSFRLLWCLACNALIINSWSWIVGSSKLSPRSMISSSLSTTSFCFDLSFVSKSHFSNWFKN